MHLEFGHHSSIWKARASSWGALRLGAGHLQRIRSPFDQDRVPQCTSNDGVSMVVLTKHRCRGFPFQCRHLEISRDFGDKRRAGCDTVQKKVDTSWKNTKSIQSKPLSQRKGIQTEAIPSPYCPKSIKACKVPIYRGDKHCVEVMPCCSALNPELLSEHYLCLPDLPPAGDLICGLRFVRFVLGW